jgi:hypothetical protein
MGRGQEEDRERKGRGWGKDRERTRRVGRDDKERNWRGWGEDGESRERGQGEDKEREAGKDGVEEGVRTGRQRGEDRESQQCLSHTQPLSYTLRRGSVALIHIFSKPCLREAEAGDRNSEGGLRASAQNPWNVINQLPVL